MTGGHISGPEPSRTSRMSPLGTVPWKRIFFLLAQEAHQIDAWIDGSDQILGAGIDEYPVALPIRKILSRAKLGVSVLEHPAVTSARVRSECHPSPKNFSCQSQTWT